MTTTLRSLLLAAVLLTVLSGAARAQSIRGELLDADRGRPIPGARLTLVTGDGTPLDSARSDRAGRFTVRAPAAGEYLLHFQLDGWAGVTSNVVRVRADGATDFVFRVPLVANSAVLQMNQMIGMDERLQSSLPEICGEPFRAWEAGLLLGVVRQRATREPVPGARVTVEGAGAATRSTVANERGIYVLCNVPVGPAVKVVIETTAGTETTDVEIRPGTASWYDLPIGPRRR